MTFLPDVNVWGAIAHEDHVHYAQARDWFEASRDHEIAFCRVTQMGLLRLLTNRHVMGMNTVTPEQAWKIFDRFLDDDRISLAPEPQASEEHWRMLMHRPDSGPNVWTDAYLAAFVAQAGFTLVTFDKGFAHYRDLKAHFLS